MVKRALLLLFGISFLGLSSWASPQKVDPKYQDAARLVARMLQEYHFDHASVDLAKSNDWIKNYMEGLDYNRLFFNASDLIAFQTHYSDHLAISLHMGNLDPAFNIFNVFKQRMDERVLWIEKRLKQPFDFSADDYYTKDRSESNWPMTQAESDELWEKRLKYDLLQEKMALLLESKNKTENASKEGAEKEDSKTSPAPTSEKEESKQEQPESSPTEKILKRYQRFAKTVHNFDQEDIIQSYLSALTSLYDPHSQYMSPSVFEDFSIGMKLSLFGIGAVLTTEDGYCTVKEVIRGGPASLDGTLQVNDRIIGVAQNQKDFVDVVDMRLRNVVHLIRGKKGSVVRLRVIPAEAEGSSVHRDIQIVRDKINLTAQKARAELIELNTAPSSGPSRIGLIDIPSFYGEMGDDSVLNSMEPSGPSTTQDVSKLLIRLKEENIQGLIIDLRNNGGGLLSEAVKVVGLFIDNGPVVQIRDTRDRITVLKDEDKGVLYTGPLIVLTNKGSASASEIVAGALQNYRRALIIGDKSTHGKGTVQAVLKLGRYMEPKNGLPQKAGAFKLTIQKFYLPNGHSTQNRGIIPDLALPSLNDYLEIGESHLPHALPWDEINSTSFAPLPYVDKPLITQLSTLSHNRIDRSPDYKFLREDIDRLKQKMLDKRVSLKETVCIKEIEEKKARDEARKTAYEKGDSFKPKIVSITLDNLKGKLLDLDTPSSASKTKPETSEKEEDEKTSLAGEDFTTDLHLKETIKIMTDWLTLSTNHSLTAQTK